MVISDCRYSVGFFSENYQSSRKDVSSKNVKTNSASLLYTTSVEKSSHNKLSICRKAAIIGNHHPPSYTLTQSPFRFFYFFLKQNQEYATTEYSVKIFSHDLKMVSMSENKFSLHMHAASLPFLLNLKVSFSACKYRRDREIVSDSERSVIVVSRMECHIMDCVPVEIKILADSDFM